MKIAIAGSGRIVQTCLETLREIDSITCTTLCVRPQSLQKGEAIARAFSIPHVVTDYSRLLADGDFDFVYIGIVNQLHYSYAKQALEAGHHVILEKPMTSTYEEMAHLAQLAKQQNCYLLEAITNIHSPILAKVRQLLPRLRDVKLLQSNYSQYSSRYDDYLEGRVHPAFDPACSGGALFDLNIYNLHIAAALFGKPDSVRYLANTGHNGIDTSGTVAMTYPGKVAVCTGAKDSESPGFTLVQGTNGFIRINGATNACQSVSWQIDGETGEFADPNPDFRMLSEFRAFEQIWREQDWPRHLELLEHSLTAMHIAHTARMSAGIRFAADL
ncbi:Gfo/Idh/MocA family oxidoreductase [Ruminococcaceae bacterium OttesenSCG-928-L11]|nr:Gfo/Idh/MocA family oxidoreductase [Ruminococcaceae bacterium OttesenSCG-928-L11]